MPFQLLVQIFLPVSGVYQLAATFFESFLNFEKSFCSWPSEMNNSNKILKDMDLIYFNRMKMRGERLFFFFFQCDNIDVCLPQILTQKLSVYIGDNSVNLYREETLKNILLIIHFPLEPRATLNMIYSMSQPKWKI